VTQSSVAGMSHEALLALLAERDRELAQAREQLQAKTRDLEESVQFQTATSDVLKVISRSTFYLQPVLDSVCRSAQRLCSAGLAGIAVRKGDVYRYVATSTANPEWDAKLRGTTFFPSRDSVAGRVLLKRRVVHVEDLTADPEYGHPEFAAVGGARTALGVPLLREGETIGVIFLGHDQVRPFTERQIDLVRTFADQAVIAIENARLFDEVQAKTRELTEALTYQTGSSKILSVIASSPTDVGPVLNAVVETACEFCEAYDAIVVLKDGSDLISSAHHGPIPMHEARWPNDRNAVSGRAVADRLPVQLRDVLSDEGAEFPTAQEMARLNGFRSILGVPMIRNDEAVGAILLRRTEVNPFSDKQISLLQTFADQAVIAIENARLFKETKDALERQTATADILKVIASSQSDVQPVFEAIATSANWLIGGFSTAVFRFVDGTCELAAFTPTSPAADEVLKTSFPQPLTHFAPLQMVANGQTVQVADTEKAPDFQIKIARARGFRSIMFSPLMSGGAVIGMISVTRAEPSSFADHHVKLLQTFADQAVIAIENARLFEEVRARTRDLTEALQMQIATSDVLKVISRSAFDLQAVFNTLVSSAVELGGALTGTICVRDGDVFRYRDTIGAEHTSKLAQYLRDNPATPGRSTIAGRVLLSGEVERIPDCLADPEYVVPMGSLATNVRSLLGVPLLRNEGVEGAIILTRGEPGHFTDRQVEIVQIFADQAVIALENVRLFEEVRARTKELAASLDDLQKAQDRLVQTEKLASLGQLTAGIAHEIKNPLNFVNNFSALSAELVGEMNDVLAKAALDKPTRDELDDLAQMLKSNLEKVVQHGKRADSIVKNMLQHSREGSGEHRPADINAIVDESLNLAYHGARAEKAGFSIALQRDLDPSVGMADVYPQEIMRVLLNLISNGFYATMKQKAQADDGFEPLISVTTKNLGDKIEIRIRDNGTGIPAEVKEKIFNPFFTTKPAGEGTGLGLSMSHDIIVKQHGGIIDVETEPGLFTELKIVLPRTSRR
jgi:two-component system NtrC family sensor kinase